MSVMPAVDAFIPARRPDPAESRAAFLEAVRVVEAVGFIRKALRERAGYLRAHNVGDREIALTLGATLPLELIWLLDEVVNGAPPAETGCFLPQAGRA